MESQKQNRRKLSAIIGMHTRMSQICHTGWMLTRPRTIRPWLSKCTSKLMTNWLARGTLFLRVLIPSTIPTPCDNFNPKTTCINHHHTRAAFVQPPRLAGLTSNLGGMNAISVDFERILTAYCTTKRNCGKSKKFCGCLDAGVGVLIHGDNNALFSTAIA